ncbi:DUF1161 domain-containing protein [Pantoea agglomerans]|uniref:DUF1161 domain-containing protein n=1 Tax=Enterobacter agglomerans TaxID=549 RepID=UPI003C7BECA3
MKLQRVLLSAALFALPLMAQASCESVKTEISQKIIQNGVPESGFSLDIVANDQVDQVGGQVVGHCENDTQKIVYKRSGSDNEASVPASAGSSQDSPAQ